MENESIEERTTTDCKEVQPTKIQHLVISGGGTYGLYAYGVLKETHEQRYMVRKGHSKLPCLLHRHPFERHCSSRL